MNNLVWVVLGFVFWRVELQYFDYANTFIKESRLSFYFVGSDSPEEKRLIIMVWLIQNVDLIMKLVRFAVFLGMVVDTESVVVIECVISYIDSKNWLDMYGEIIGYFANWIFCMVCFQNFVCYRWNYVRFGLNNSWRKCFLMKILLYSRTESVDGSVWKIYSTSDKFCFEVCSLDVETDEVFVFFWSDSKLRSCSAELEGLLQILGAQEK